MVMTMNKEQEQWIIERFDDMSIEKLRHKFNETFNKDIKSRCFYYHTQRLGLRKHVQHCYTKEQDEFLRDNSNKMTRSELCKSFNAVFGTMINENAIIQRCFLKGFKPMSDGKFKVGSVPWEKTDGGREVYVEKLKGGNRSSFRKGHKPSNYKPIGSESVRREGIFIKTEKGWKPKIQVIYEQECGECKKGERVIPIDGDKNNYAIDNMAVIDNRTQTYLISNDWYGKGIITQTGILWCRLKDVIDQSVKGNRT